MLGQCTVPAPGQACPLRLSKDCNYSRSSRSEIESESAPVARMASAFNEWKEKWKLANAEDVLPEISVHIYQKKKKSGKVECIFHKLFRGPTAHFMMKALYPNAAGFEAKI